MMPSLFQVHARNLGFPLQDVPDSFFTDVAQSFDLIYVLGIWEVGPIATQIAVDNMLKWHGLPREDVCGSCFAIKGYQVAQEFGGDVGLDLFVNKANKHGLGVILDFIPNHVGIDHPWVQNPAPHQQNFIVSAANDISADDSRYFRIVGQQKPMAHGKDPYFPPWSDTAQLNYESQELRDAMCEIVENLAKRCQGVRCDMAMLVLDDIFGKTWNRAVKYDFWKIIVKRVKTINPNFLFIAECYWGLEDRLTEEGFDYCYDKALYDELIGPLNVELIKSKLMKVNRCRFLENHDEQRASVVWNDPQYYAVAAVITYLAPGLRFYHDGQREGRSLRLPVQKRSYPREPLDEAARSKRAGIAALYERLIPLANSPIIKKGQFSALEVKPSNVKDTAYTSLLSFEWEYGSNKILVIINCSDTSVGHGRVPFGCPGDDSILLCGLWDGVTQYRRSASEARTRGIWFSLRPLEINIFSIRPLL